MRFTASIVRWHMFGTHNHYLSLLYHGRDVGPVVPPARPGDRVEFKLISDDAQGVDELRAWAKKKGFTHVRIAGDWTGRTAPKGGKL